jgi:predicted RNA-binding Zn-ribbon protein involved in translation (DUF1610 family)
MNIRRTYRAKPSALKPICPDCGAVLVKCKWCKRKRENCGLEFAGRSEAFKHYLVDWYYRPSSFSCPYCGAVLVECKRCGGYGVILLEAATAGCPDCHGTGLVCGECKGEDNE